MRVIKSIKSLQASIKGIKSQNRSIGFVPTMGALHDGHLSLIKNSRRENDTTIISIFVNPKQFGPKEDFFNYPRPEKKDILLAKKEKIDIIFYPSEKEMYPTSFLTSIQVDQMTKGLCGKSRPGHFQGVATVVGKLLNIVTPDILYLGQKDAQQAIMIKQLARDLNFPVLIKVCPTVREADGLALSSRNIKLKLQHRKEAPILFESLTCAQKMIRNGEDNSAKIINWIRANIKNHSSGKIDYIECVNAESLAPLPRIQGKAMIALAVYFGQTRLIDNIIVHK